MVNGQRRVSAIFTNSMRNGTESHSGAPVVSSISSREFRVSGRAVLAAALLLWAAPALARDASSAQEFSPGQDLSLAMNQARLLKLPNGVATLVIGNPAIADATLQPGGLLVLTGKSYGRTNLIALDSHGAILTERDISVAAAGDGTVTVYRGPTGARQTLDCDQRCEVTVTIGDEAPVFDGTVKQITDRNSLSGGK